MFAPKDRRKKITVKRLLSFYILISLVLLTVLAATGCQRFRQGRNDGRITVTSLTFPSYDFVRAIAGDRVSLTLLTSPGMESHSFEPSPRDIINIRDSDLFIYPGGEGADWLHRIFEAAGIANGTSNRSSEDHGPKVLRMLEMVEGLEEEFVEGMEVYHGYDHDQHHHHDHEHHGHDEHHDEVELDEHVWTSPRNAILIVSALAEVLAELDPANAAFFQSNAAAYIAQLREQDTALQAVVSGARRNLILVGDRFPFRYLAHHYGLEYYAAFSGCSTDTEPSAATVAFLINTVRREQLPVVFHIELSNERIADTISEATGARKLLLHSAQNVSMEEFTAGLTYLDILRNNVETLREALW